MHGSPEEVVKLPVIEWVLAGYPGAPRRHANSTIVVILTHRVTAWMSSAGYRETGSP
jgi:hypothetical protein